MVFLSKMGSFSAFVGKTVVRFFTLQCVLKVFLVYLVQRHANQETKTSLGLESRLA